VSQERELSRESRVHRELQGPEQLAPLAQLVTPVCVARSSCGAPQVPAIFVEQHHD
jgi:hypothetical protein